MLAASKDVKFISLNIIQLNLKITKLKKKRRHNQKIFLLLFCLLLIYSFVLIQLYHLLTVVSFSMLMLSLS